MRDTLVDILLLAYCSFIIFFPYIICFKPVVSWLFHQSFSNFDKWFQCLHFSLYYITIMYECVEPYWKLYSMFWTTIFTVFLSRFGAFLTSLLTFAQHLVQPPQHLVICAHHSSSFSFLPTNCKCFWTCINCFHTTLCCFITLSFAYVMSVKIN